jgi:uncharacterized protein YfaS (alpha-2-macroglobulin family)
LAWLPLHPYLLMVRQVIRSYSARTRSAEGPPLSSVCLGSVVSVTIQVTTADEVANLLIEDWLPSGELLLIRKLGDGREDWLPAGEGSRVESWRD